MHANAYGEAFVGKYRSDNEIVQLGLISPESVQVELRGQRIVYVLSTLNGQVEVGPEDVLHFKGMSLDGLRGMSPVTQARVALGLSSSLQQSAKVYTENGSKPTGVLTSRTATPRRPSGSRRRGAPSTPASRICTASPWCPGRSPSPRSPSPPMTASSCSSAN